MRCNGDADNGDITNYSKMLKLVKYRVKMAVSNVLDRIFLSKLRNRYHHLHFSFNFY